MEEQYTVQHIIDDLKRFGDFPNAAEVPEQCIRYILLNHYIIELCVDAVYTEMSKAQREELRKSHEELSLSIVSDTSFKIVKSNLDRVRSESAGSIFGSVLSEDDLRVIIRALEYAKYVPIRITILRMP